MMDWIAGELLELAAHLTDEGYKMNELILKPGDKALVEHLNLGRSTYDIVTVERVTATQIVLKETTTRYRKNGEEIGRETGRMAWGNHKRLVAYDEQIVKQEEERLRITREVDYLSDIKWGKLDEETRHAVYVLIKSKEVK